MNINTTYIPLHRPIIRYDEDGNYFFSQIGTLLHNSADGHIEDIFGKGTISRVGECGYDGEIIQEDGTPHDVGINDIDQAAPALCFFRETIPLDHPMLLCAVYKDYWDFGLPYKKAYEKQLKKLSSLGVVISTESGNRNGEVYRYSMNLRVLPQKTPGRHKSYILVAKRNEGLPFDYGFTKKSTPKEVATLIREDVEGILYAVYKRNDLPILIQLSVTPAEGLAPIPWWRLFLWIILLPIKK